MTNNIMQEIMFTAYINASNNDCYLNLVVTISLFDRNSVLSYHSIPCRLCSPVYVSDFRILTLFLFIAMMSCTVLHMRGSISKRINFVIFFTHARHLWKETFMYICWSCTVGLLTWHTCVYFVIIIIGGRDVCRMRISIFWVHFAYYNNSIFCYQLSVLRSALPSRLV